MQQASQSNILEYASQTHRPDTANPFVFSGFRRSERVQFERALAIRFVLDGAAHAGCLLDENAANRLFGEVNWSALSIPLRVQFVDDRLRQLGEPLSRILSMVRSVSDVQVIDSCGQLPFGDDTERFELNLSEANQLAGRCTLFVNSAAQGQVLSGISQLTKSDNKVRFLLPVRCEFVGIVDSPVSLTEVKAGDVILFDERESALENGEQVRVFVMGRCVGLARWADKQAVEIVDVPSSLVQAAAAPGADKVSFEFDHGSVDLIEFARIGVNYQFAASIDSSAQIRVLIDNQAVGLGHYVRVGSRRGVRIDTWDGVA